MKKHIFIFFIFLLLLGCSINNKAFHEQKDVVMDCNCNKSITKSIEKQDEILIPENNIEKSSKIISNYISAAKEMELISSIELNEEFPSIYFDWTNNRLYITHISYIDLSDMIIKKINLPGEGYEALRAPYSNNTIHLGIGEEDNYKYFIYNLNDKTMTGPLDDLSYYFTYYDSDRRYTNCSVYTDKYTVAIESGWCYWLLTDTGVKYSEYNNENQFIINKINNEFRNTIFDNEYIMELIKIVNNSFSDIITKNGCSLSTTWCRNDYPQISDRLDIRYELEEKHLLEKKQYDAAVYFLYKLLDLFPENNVIDELKIRTMKGYYGSTNQSLSIDIFNNGFYAHTNEKLIVLDIKNKLINYYNITINSGDGGDGFKLSPDGKTGYFYRWLVDKIEIYKL